MWLFILIPLFRSQCFLRRRRDAVYLPSFFVSLLSCGLLLLDLCFRGNGTERVSLVEDTKETLSLQRQRGCLRLELDSLQVRSSHRRDCHFQSREYLSQVMHGTFGNKSSCFTGLIVFLRQNLTSFSSCCPARVFLSSVVFAILCHRPLFQLWCRRSFELRSADTDDGVSDEDLRWNDGWMRKTNHSLDCRFKKQTKSLQEMAVITLWFWSFRADLLYFLLESNCGGIPVVSERYHFEFHLHYREFHFTIIAASCLLISLYIQIYYCHSLLSCITHSLREEVIQSYIFLRIWNEKKSRGSRHHWLPLNSNVAFLSFPSEVLNEVQSYLFLLTEWFSHVSSNVVFLCVSHFMLCWWWIVNHKEIEEWRRFSYQISRSTW